MKNKLLALSLIALSSFLIIGCNNQNNQNIDSQDINNQSSQDDEDEENQALYNRIILDYYEQIVQKEWRVQRIQSGFLNVHSDGETWAEINFAGNTRYSRKNITLDNIGAYFLGKNDKGVYTLLFEDPLEAFDHGYGMMCVTNMFLNGVDFRFDWSECMSFFCWYKGKIMRPSEALKNGLIEMDDICTLRFDNEGNLIKLYNYEYYYNKSVDSLPIEDIYSEENAELTKLKNDFYNKLVNDNVNTLLESPLIKENIHLSDTFGTFNGKELLTIVVDNVHMRAYNGSPWDADLVLGDVSLTASFGTSAEQDIIYQPLVYFNNDFYSLGDAYENNILTNEDVLLIKKSLIDEIEIRKVPYPLL